jgi:Family of unknown function (DUF5329)
MNPTRLLLSLILNLAMLPAAHAAPPAAVMQTEINYLLGYVKSSGCEFYRNGSWYDSAKAQAHLRYKYEAFAARHRITSAEDFIEVAATKSSFSGRPYQIRCGGGEAVSSNRWLHEVLDRFRAHGAPRVTRGALEPES